MCNFCTSLISSGHSLYRNRVPSQLIRRIKPFGIDPALTGTFRAGNRALLEVELVSSASGHTTLALVQTAKDAWVNETSTLAMTHTNRHEAINHREGQCGINTS
jgi:hypothetical protein